MRLDSVIDCNELLEQMADLRKRWSSAMFQISSKENTHRHRIIRRDLSEQHIQRDLDRVADWSSGRVHGHAHADDHKRDDIGTAEK